MRNFVLCRPWGGGGGGAFVPNKDNAYPVWKTPFPTMLRLRMDFEDVVARIPWNESQSVEIAQSGFDLIAQYLDMSMVNLNIITAYDCEPRPAIDRAP